MAAREENVFDGGIVVWFIFSFCSAGILEWRDGGFWFSNWYFFPLKMT